MLRIFSILLVALLMTLTLPSASAVAQSDTSVVMTSELRELVKTFFADLSVMVNDHDPKFFDAVTDNGLNSLFGTADRTQIMDEVYPGLRRMRIYRVDSMKIGDHSLISARVSFSGFISPSEQSYRSMKFSLISGKHSLLIESAAGTQTVYPKGTAVEDIEIKLTDGAVSLPISASKADFTNITFRNDGSQMRVILLYDLKGLSLDELVSRKELPEESSLILGVGIAPQAENLLTIVGFAEGTYAVLDLSGEDWTVLPAASITIK